MLVAEAEGIDVLIEVTGAIEYGAARRRSTAFEHGKHVVLMNAELDGTLGPILKTDADAAGVVFTDADGDQPGVEMNLYRFVKGIGLTPAALRQHQGPPGPVPQPDHPGGLRAPVGPEPDMVTTFADGTKISFEQAIVANATGMRSPSAGCTGRRARRATSTSSRSPTTSTSFGPGASSTTSSARQPSPGVFVLGTHDDPRQRHYLNLYKLGEGPLYSFYTPYHLCHFEVPNTVARAVLFGDAAIAPAGRPVVDVVATAKLDLGPGDELDALGGYLTYGLAENADVAASRASAADRPGAGLPLLRDLPKDPVLTYDDVEMPPGRLSDRLRVEQDASGRERSSSSDRP